MLLTVTGQSKPFDGKAAVQICLGKGIFQHEVLFADITHDGILGIDFMIQNKCDLIISKSCLKVKGQEIPCYMSNGIQPTCCRVALIDHINVPPESEIIVAGKPIDNLDRSKPGLVEPSMQFVENTGLLVAKVLVDPKSGKIPLRFINLSKEPISVYKDTVTAVLQPVEYVDTEKVNVSQMVENNSNQAVLPEYLHPLYERSSENLDEVQRERLEKFLIKHQNAFSMSSSDIGHTTLLQHQIDVQNAKPVKKAPYRIPLAKRQVAEKEIQEMAENGIIEKCPQSGWNAPVVMVTKPDKSIRFCCDFRGLNEVTVKDCQPLPRIDDSLEALSGSKWWSCLDMKSGYWQVDIREEDRHKTAFAIPGGEQWQWRKLAFGLCNAPSTFTRLMQMVFSGLLWKIVILYLDDIICHSKTFEEQLVNLELVFERLRKANLKLNPKKCHLFQTQVTFLGHSISQNGIGTLPSKIESIKNWPTPRNAKEARSFISLASYYRSYVYQFATIAKPIHQLAEKERNFQWTAECEKSFLTIKEALCSAPILAFPTETDPFVVDTDASGVGQGAVLSQIQNGEEKVISYFSRCFSRSERNYCVTRRELVAVVSAIKHFHHYLYGARFTIRTDHGSLRWLLNFKILDGQLARMLSFLSTYNFSIEHRAGRLHSNCDALSRRPCLDLNCRYCENVDSKFHPDTDTFEISKVGDKQEELLAENIQSNVEMEHIDIVGSVGVDSSSRDKCNRPDEYPTDSIQSNVEREVGVKTEYCRQIGVTKQIKPTPEPQPGTSQEDTDRPDSSTEFDGSPTSSSSEEIDWENFDNAKIRELQLEDSVLKKLHEWKERGHKPEWSEVASLGLEIKYFWHRWQLLCIREGVLYRRWESENGNDIKFLVIVPKTLRQFVLSQLHDGVTGAHLGIGKTLGKVRERFFWYALKRDIEEWCVRCEICCSRKMSHKQAKAPMKQYNVGLPMERVAIDFMGPLTKTKPQNGNAPKRYLMVIGDYFTKWTEAIPLENIEAKTVARALIDQFITRFGVPLFIHTDQGASFESKLFQEICQIMGIKKTRTTKARPQSDGMIERANRTILNMLAAFVSEHQRDWDEYIPLVMMAYRSSIHESTSTSACKMTFGHEIRLPIDLLFSQPERETEESRYGSQYVNQLSDKMNEVHEFARSRLKIASDAMKKNYDIKSNLFEFQVGDAVWFYDPVRKVGLSPKLQRPWKGPFKVMTKISDILYRIQQSPRHKPRVVHHDKLRKYSGKTTSAWFSHAQT